MNITGNHKVKAKKAGRPKGKRTDNAPTTDALPSPCPNPACGSTRQQVVRKLPTQIYAGEHLGRPYTAIERRRCVCLDCGQLMIRREHVYRPEVA